MQCARISVDWLQIRGTNPTTTSKSNTTKIMKIETTTEIQSAFVKFAPSNDGAFATGRCLSGQWEQANQQEWAERGTIDGTAATVYYIFDNAEANVEDGADMPFDSDHISYIEIEEEDEEPYGEPTKMKTQIKYATGVEGGDNSIEETIDRVREQFAAAVFYTRSGDAVTGSSDWDGSPVLVWETESESLNDDGSAAIAEITTAQPEPTNKINTHTNPNGETYFSKEGENGEAIYSFSELFEDTWSQADENLYGNTKMKNTINTTTENGETRIIDMNGSPHNQNVSVWDSTGAAQSMWTYESGLDLLQNHPEDLVLTDEQIETLKQFEPLAL